MKQKRRSDNKRSVYGCIWEKVNDHGQSEDTARWFVYCALQCKKICCSCELSSDLREGGNTFYYLPLKNR